tara:strand:+ start:1233 stop:1688 length:456 start_codon:yes stop_codon:yes gene_type:complete
MSGIVGSIPVSSTRQHTVFASGTKMLFNQTAAPTGWTKVTGSGNDTALRVTTGTVGTGGSVAFETAFASQDIADHTLTLAETPAHGHSFYLYTVAGSGGSTGNRVTNAGSGYYSNNSSFGSINNAGGGSAHNHGAINLDVSYVDVIIATKD